MTKPASEVTTTMRAPTQKVDDSPQLLYRPLEQQLTPETVPFKVRWEYVTPDQAEAWLFEADHHEGFRPRPRTEARKKHWLNLMQTGRFVEFSPEGVLCFSPEGICLNGGNRLGAVVEYDQPVGFTIFENVPVWMSRFFDTGDKRTLREAMFMNKKDLPQGYQQVVRLGMRYEEYLFGKRSAHGWADWSRHKDEHQDVDNFIERREYLLDYIPKGKAIRKPTNLQAASITAFVAYQLLAWPDGASELEQFLDGLALGSMLHKGNPALTLREWGKADGFIGNGTHGRREGHLLLLFRSFEKYMEELDEPKILVARGLPMHMPYHPNGDKTAVANVRKALGKMDAGR